MNLPEEDFFMSLAFLARARSKDGDRQVGACIAVGNPPILAGLGYNGMPDGPGFKDSEMKWKKPEKHRLECHAETNAIVSAFRRQADFSKSTLYVTDSPCMGCCKLALQSKIGEVVWANEYTQSIPEDIKDHIKSTARRDDRFLAVEQYLYKNDKETTRQEQEQDHEQKQQETSANTEEKEKKSEGCTYVPYAFDVQQSSAKDTTTYRQYKGKKKIVKIDLGPSSEEASEQSSAEGGAELKHCDILDTPAEGQGQGEREEQGQEQKCDSDKSTNRKEKKPRDVDVSKDDFFMAVAKLATIRSTSTGTKVGACVVTVNPHRVVSCGYSECYKPSDDKIKYSASSDSLYQNMCAELNAITSAFRAHADLSSSVLYTTAPLCAHCARIVVQSGVKIVIYSPSNLHKDDKKEVEEIFYRARIPYLEYQRQTKKRYININLEKKEIYQTT